jgi:hypothetical protein
MSLPVIGLSRSSEGTPWERLPGESSLWYARFRKWLAQKSPRSLLASYNEEVAEKGGKERALSIPHSWDVAKEKYHWAERAAAWDTAEQERLDRELMEKREQQRARELRAAEKLYDKADDLMSLSHLKEVEKEETEAGEMTVVRLPDHKAFKTAADLYAEARTNARAALEMTDKRIDIRKLS